MLRTAEHVSQGHPDKFADQLADAILDAALDLARESGASTNLPDHPAQQRTAIEMVAKDRLIVISGEARFGPRVRARLDISGITRRVWSDVGYTGSDDITVLDHIRLQSPELSAMSDWDGAGDQGIMVGYATTATSSGLPLEYQLARDLCHSIQLLRQNGKAPWIRADTKTQVTIDEGGRPKRIVIAVQHEATIGQAEIKSELMRLAVRPILGDSMDPHNVSVNGTKSFVIGGTMGDAGVVGRKIVVDAYGPHVPVGGGAYSGKDPTKVDRSAAYMARHIAKTAATLRIRGAKAVTVHIAYCIGQTEPDMVQAETDTGIDISDWVVSRFPRLSPRSIRDQLGLWRDTEEAKWRYQQTAAFGHYGRSGFPWEDVAPVSD